MNSINRLDFGDCHRSIFSHEDSILGLQFVSKTHLFFSCGKDGKLKQWDADNFENITTLSGHHGQVWTLAVSEDGKYVSTAGHDRSIRLWERTQEPLVLEDERETQREAEADQVFLSFWSCFLSFLFFPSRFAARKNLLPFRLNYSNLRLGATFILQIG